MKQFLKNQLNLGLIIHNGRVRNHRTLVKVLFNPILRLFKYEIGSVVQMDTNTVERCMIVKCNYPNVTPLCWTFKYPMDDNTTVKHIRCWL